MIKGILWGLILITLFLPRESNGENIYKWKSEDGSLHFSNYLPEGIGKTKEKIDKNGLTNFFNSRINDSKKKHPAINPPLEHSVNSIFTLKNGKSIGTGFFISPKGYAITCKHIIEKTRDHIAILENHKEYPVGIIATSSENDLALIMVIAQFETPYLTIRDPNTVQIDEQVYTVGSSLNLQTDIADGRFKGFRVREDTGDKVLQFSALVNAGNSGSPLMDSNGRVIGVVSWKIISQKGVPAFGLGFAVPSHYILEEYGTFREIF